MKRTRIVPVAVFASLCALTPSLARGEDPAKNPNAVNPIADPFYRKYLVPGNPLDDEILAMEKRIEASPDDAHLRNDFGNLLALRHFPEQAAGQYELAAELDASNFIAYYNLGLLRETEGKIGPAIAAYKSSIARKPGFPQSRFRLGRLYEHTGKPDEAVTQYAKALWIDPGMRDPKRNPLVIDSDLMYRASLSIYERDMARATLDRDASFAEEPSFRRIPVDRAVATAEIDEDAEPATGPREIGAGSGAPTSPSTPGNRRARPATTTAPTDGTMSKQPRAPGSRPPARGARPGQPQPASPPPGAPVPVVGAPRDPTPAVAAPEEPGEPQMQPENVPEPETTPVPNGEAEVEPS